ncbi:hypothetical protein CLV98_11258 [Dyadobacter jejuensis]|uniref:Uncharacterized protein n=1 Tax=Dyadobacter jejuensis TaxID=1082580 RepID=A0A316AGB7_9BACT|nr:hypothetical protein [Dyadobacter jejuensis]PWJ55964.1 hypothetical protein CLV98_11258 [Dyadobacter jejuensis]
MKEQLLHIVTYTGPFGFIKPWTAVRDERTFSQQFLTPSIIEGMRIRLGVTEIVRHKLTYAKIDQQQERTQSRGFKEIKKKASREQSILIRGVMLNPILKLAFTNQKDAKLASEQHICLCRNEDILLPEIDIQSMSEGDFEEVTGFELLFQGGSNTILVGYNRYQENKPMFGVLKITGNPVGSDPFE